MMWSICYCFVYKGQGYCHWNELSWKLILIEYSKLQKMGLDKKVGYVRSSENDFYYCKTNNLRWDFILSNLEYGFNLLRNEKTYDII